MAKNVNICDVCTEIFAGGDAPKGRISKTRTEEFAIPIYSNGEENAGLYGFTDVSRVNVPSVTVSARGTIGYAAIRTEPFVPIVRLITLVPDESKIDIKYLYYAVQNYQFEGSGTSIPQLTVPMLKKYNFTLPTKEVQKNVVSALDKVNALIALRKEQLAKLDELVKARFVEMFGTIHDNKLCYEIKTLQDVCEQIKDGTHQTPTYTDDTVNGYKFLSSKDVTTGKIDWSHLKYIPEELHNELYARIAPQKGDVLLAKNGTTGIAAIVDRDEIFDIYVSLALLRPIDVESVYLWAAINSAETKHQFDASLKGIGVPNLHLGEIKKAKILIPPIDEQKKFAAFVEQTNKTKLTIQASLDKLEVMKKALMQEYFG